MSSRREVRRRVLAEVGTDRLECICEYLDMRFDRGNGCYPGDADLVREFPWMNAQQRVQVLDYWQATYAVRMLRDALLVR